jgi:hypothetical protein
MMGKDRGANSSPSFFIIPLTVKHGAHVPKLNNTLLIDRLQKRIAQLENDEAIEAREINSLLNKDQQAALKAAWSAQQTLRKQHKPPTTDAAKNAVGWKTIKEVRIEALTKALADASRSVLESLRSEMKRREARAAKVFLEAYFEAKDAEKNAISIANIAVTRAGFSSKHVARTRDEEVRQMEETLLARLTKAGEEQE